MSFTTQSIKYGWLALASLGVITGTTIYVLDNQRKQVKPEDIIEIVLGVHERCLATQYATNPPAYRVSPPSFVRTWTSNVYTTNSVTIYTNTVTNTIGWHIDRAMMVSLDSTIKSLVPYYVDTNTVYDGSSNIAPLTVTGLWASLGIGDLTNKFTRSPALGTNVATYGDYPWQIYVEDLQERYKVLNAMRMTPAASSHMRFTNLLQTGRGLTNDWDEAKIMAEAVYLTNSVLQDRNFGDSTFAIYSYGSYYPGEAELWNQSVLSRPVNLSTNIEVLNVRCFVRAYPQSATPIYTWDYNGIDISSNYWKEIEPPFGFVSNEIPEWASGFGGEYPDGNYRGFYYYFDSVNTLQFDYCTNKYW